MAWGSFSSSAVRSRSQLCDLECACLSDRRAFQGALSGAACSRLLGNMLVFAYRHKKKNDILLVCMMRQSGKLPIPLILLSHNICGTTFSSPNGNFSCDTSPTVRSPCLANTNLVSIGHLSQSFLACSLLGRPLSRGTAPGQPRHHRPLRSHGQENDIVAIPTPYPSKRPRPRGKQAK